MTVPSGNDPGNGPGQRRQVWGRRRGRKLTPGSETRMAEWMAALGIDLPEAGAALDPAALFGAPVSDIWLEIGFGVGDHLLAQAQAHPQVGLLGCEPYLNGVAKLIHRIDESAAQDPTLKERIRLLSDDARLLLAALPDGALSRAFILFPDPWPKKRHHDRRMVSPWVLAQMVRLLKPGGELRLATDVPDYARWMLFHAQAEPGLSWMARRPQDWRVRPADWPSSKYERKAIAAGRTCLYFRFQRI